MVGAPGRHNIVIGPSEEGNADRHLTDVTAARELLIVYDELFRTNDDKYYHFMTYIWGNGTIFYLQYHLIFIYF